MFWQICGDERSAVQLKMSDEIAAPMVFGMFRITLLIPGTAASTPSSPALLQTCLKHEWSHIKNGDLMTWNLIRLFQYPLWMQPFYWMLRNRLLADQDYLADDEACSDIADYAQILLNFAQIRSVKKPGSVLGMAERKSQIRRRIDMLLNEIRPTRTSNKRKLLLPLILFIAITLLGSSLRFSESQEPPKEPGAERSAVPGQEPGIAIELTDPDGKPCTTGYARTYPDPRPQDWEGDQPRNFDLTDGKCFVPISNFSEQKSFKIVLYADGFTPYEFRWTDTAKEALPTKLSFKMSERAAEPIGGRIVDEDGKPVADAIVQFSVSLAGRSNNPDKVIQSYAQWIKTNADGYWIYKVLPTEQLEQNFDMSIEHAKYPRLRFHKGQTFKAYAVKDADGKFAKTIVMPKGLPLKGKIVDEQDKPVAGVIVHCNAAWRDPDKPYGHEAVKSGEDGTFLFETCSPKGDLDTVDIGVCHNDFAPDIIVLAEITSGMEPLNIVLKKGKKIIFKAVDKDNKPIEGVSISSRYWKNFWGPGTGTHQLFVNADAWGIVKTGKDGRFVWENAPDNRSDLIIQDENYQNVQIDYKTLKYGDEENVYVFKPLMNVTGTVVDAETGKPIPNFAVTEWFAFKTSGGSLTREFGSQVGSEGRFTRTVGQRFGEFDKYYLRVDADGYEGLHSEDLIAKTGDTALEFKLKKATGAFVQNLTGTVLQPDGKPAANTVIGIVVAGRELQTRGTMLQKGGMRQESKTDKAGKFSISRSDMSIGDQDYQLIFIHDTGTIQLSKEEFEKHTEPITLQAWGRIEGTVRAGSKPVPNALIYWTMTDRAGEHLGMPDYTKARITRYCWEGEKTDANGHYSFRIFPGKSSIGRLAPVHDSKWSHPFLTKEFDIKPGETLQIDLGGGGYIVKGQVVIPLDETPKPVDWRFGYIAARPAVPKYVAMPALSEEAEQLRVVMAAAFTKEVMVLEDKGRGLTLSNFDDMFNRWSETPEGKALIAQNREAFEEVKRNMDFEIGHEERVESGKRVVCAMEEGGKFQLDDLTPGNWTLEVSLSFPSVPKQWWDFADIWKKEIDVTIPEFPADRKVEVLEIPVIPLGYDKSDHKGPEQ